MGEDQFNNFVALQELSCFRIQNESDTLTHWNKIFMQFPSITFAKGHTILEQQNEIHAVYYILDGFMEYVYCDPDGEEHLIDLMSIGNVCGVQTLFSKEHISLGCFRALTDITVCEIPSEKVLQLILQDSSLGIELLEELSRITAGVVMQSFSKFQNAERRVDSTLLLMAEVIMRKTNTDKNIMIPLTQSDLARICHTTRVTVTKSIKELKKQKILNTTYGGLFIWDVLRLRDYVYP